MHAVTQAPGLAAVAIVLLLLEIFWRTSVQAKGYDFAGAAASFGVFIGNIVIGGAVSAAIIGPVYFWCWSVAPVKLPIDDWRVWALCFFAVEFAYYWQHRISHTVRWLWASHAVHHSAQTLALPSAVRLGWTAALSGGWLFFTPLVVAGFNPLMVAAIFAANLHYQFWLHTEAVGKLGPLEWLFNTPSHHRVHHASNTEYLDKNFGGVLIVFDRLFGTFVGERDDRKIRYGLTTPLRSNNPFVIALHEWANLAREAARSRSFSELRMALIGRPGEWARRRQARHASPARFISSAYQSQGIE